VRREVLSPVTSPRAFEGIVHDAAGEPVFGADVWIGDEGLQTDGDGRFLVTGYCGEAVDLEVAKPGYVSAIVRAWPLRGGTVLPILLETERSLVVSVRSTSGRPLSDVPPAAREPDDERSWTSIPLGRGAWRFEGLPAHALVLSVRLGGRVLEEPIAATTSEWTFVVPEWSDVTVDLGGLRELAEARLLPASLEIAARIARSLDSRRGETVAGEPLYGVLVVDVASGETVFTASSARAETVVTRLLDGDYDVHAWTAEPAETSDGGSVLTELKSAGTRLSVRGEHVRLEVIGSSLAVARP
jgi:hypothetical protein